MSDEPCPVHDAICGCAMYSEKQKGGKHFPDCPRGRATCTGCDQSPPTNYVPAARRIRPMLWHALIGRRVTVMRGRFQGIGGVEEGGTIHFPVGWAFTKRGAFRIARREIAKRGLPESPLFVKMPDMGGRSR